MQRETFQKIRGKPNPWANRSQILSKSGERFYVFLNIRGLDPMSFQNLTSPSTEDTGFREIILSKFLCCWWTSGDCRVKVRVRVILLLTVSQSDLVLSPYLITESFGFVCRGAPSLTGGRVRRVKGHSPCLCPKYVYIIIIIIINARPATLC